MNKELLNEINCYADALIDFYDDRRINQESEGKNYFIVNINDDIETAIDTEVFESLDSDTTSKDIIDIVTKKFIEFFNDYTCYENMYPRNGRIENLQHGQLAFIKKEMF